MRNDDHIDSIIVALLAYPVYRWIQACRRKKLKIGVETKEENVDEREDAIDFERGTADSYAAKSSSESDSDSSEDDEKVVKESESNSSSAETVVPAASLPNEKVISIQCLQPKKPAATL